MASSNQTPDVLFSPIAANADASDINTIPQTYDPANYGYAAQNVGFPTECRLPVLNPDGTLGQGRAPRMQDWNGIMKLVSSHNFFLQNGGSYTFNPTVSSNIGGYPKNAVLWYFPENEAPCLVYSLINDNTNNFVNDPTLIDGIHWEMLVNPSSYANIALTNSPYTTNRILEIPQDIKLELSNGTLTLKAGSKVYVPNGFESDGTTPKFDTLTISNDVTLSIGTITSERFIIVDANGTHLDIGNPSVFASGSSNPGSGKYYWYDTTLNLLRRSASADGSFDSNTRSLTLGVISKNGDSIDQVFNGFGYIGSTVFALPDIKVQGAFGVNEDGTYKLKTFVTDRVLTFLFGSNVSGNYTVGFDVGEDGTILYFGGYAEEIKVGEKQPSGTNFSWWNPIKGETRYVDFSGIAENTPYTAPRLGQVIVSSGRVNSIIQNSIDSIVTSNALNFSQAGRSYLSGLGMPSDRYIDLTLGASGSSYRAPANGWVTLSKAANSSSSSTRRYIYAQDYNSSKMDFISYGVSTEDVIITFPVYKGEVFTVYYTATGATKDFSFIYAEGEN